jgi:hypothetical protein
MSSRQLSAPRFIDMPAPKNILCYLTKNVRSRGFAREEDRSGCAGTDGQKRLSETAFLGPEADVPLSASFGRPLCAHIRHQSFYPPSRKQSFVQLSRPDMPHQQF